MDRCKHGRVVSPVYEDCPFCLDESKNNTEREELVLKFMLAMTAAAYGDPLQYAIERADEYLQWRDKERAGHNKEDV